MPSPCDDTEQITLNVTPAIGQYLDDLIELGIFGQTRAEVGTFLISIGVEKAVTDGLISVRINVVKR